jgi:splicing factor 3B subunit 1
VIVDTAPKHLLNEFADEDAEDPFAHTAKKKQVATRQSEYQLRRFERDVGEVQKDAFQDGEATEGESYKDAMRRHNLEREEQRVRRAIEKKAQETGGEAEAAVAPDATPRKRRWDVTGDDKSPIRDVTNKEWGDNEQPVKKKRSRWDETPVTATPTAAVGETPRRSRWDQTPVGGVTPAAPVLPQGMPAPGFLDKRNRYLSDEELDEMLPSEGYEIVTPPAGYQPIRTPARKLMTAPTPVGGGGFVMQDEAAAAQMAAMAGPELPTEIEGVGALAFFKQEDATYFSKILGKQEEEGLSMEELKERKIMRLLLKIKNGTPPMRKSALRQITDNARQFGAGPLFDKILPLLMERSLEDQERHLLVKVIDRVLYKLDDLVRPYVHKILVVIEPLLIDEDYYARVEGREIISNLSKAAGLAHMISTMRPDIDHADEYVRNTTARAFSVVASALGIPSLLPFLKAVCRSKKSWQARHTGIKIVQQIAIMMGCAVLPHLKSLVESVAHGLEDEQQKVRTMTALAIAALAEAAAPYGIESFDSVLKPLWTGIRKHRGKGLAAFLKAIGFIIPLMDPEYANYYTKEVMVILIREFQSPDEEMKKIVLKVVKQCAGTDGVQPAYVKQEILPEFFKSFWVRRYVPGCGSCVSASRG